MKWHRPRLAYDPFEILLSVAFGLASLWQLMFGPSAGSSAAVLPDSLRMAWVGLLCFGCALTLVGALTVMLWGYLYELVGLFASGGSLVAFGCHVVLVQASRGSLTPANILGGPLVIIIGVAFLWKFAQVYRNVRELERSRS